jgi:epoxide hydrolase-like predicted phosphatase
MSSFDAVLWDYGGVFTASPFVALDAYARSQDVEPEVFGAVMFGSYDEDTDHVWHRLERGEVSFVDALTQIQRAAAEAGFRFDTGEVFSMLVSDQRDRTMVVEAVRHVRTKGLLTALVTNNIREYGTTWRTQLPLDELFDAVVDSSEVGLRKPDPAIFRTALDLIGVPDARRAVFLDDFAGNVAAACALGMHGILVGDDPTPALDELLALVE